MKKRTTRNMFVNTVIKFVCLIVCIGAYSGGAAANTICNSADSDIDGDGWGWENNASCIVAGSAAEPAGDAPAINYCQYKASDIDGDGWGWENGMSCQVGDSTSDSPEPVESDYEPIYAANGKLLCQFDTSDTDNDGYGWENNSSCIVPGTLAQESTTVSTLPVCTSTTSDTDNDGWGWENNQSCIVDSTSTNTGNSDADNEASDVTDDSSTEEQQDTTESESEDTTESSEESTEQNEQPEPDDNSDSEGTDSEGPPTTDESADENTEVPTGVDSEQPPEDAVEEPADEEPEDQSDTDSEVPADTGDNSTENPNDSDAGNEESTDTDDTTDTADADQGDEPAEFLPEHITDLILVTGQSNTLGSNSAVDASLDASDARVFAYTSNGWEVASLHQRWDKGAHPGTGNEEDWLVSHNNFALHFGKHLTALDPDAVIGFVLVSEPGEGIEHWSPGNTGMNRVQEKTLAAINELPHKSAIDGVLWHQGETDWQLEGTSDPDVLQPAVINYYPVQLTALIENLRLENWYDNTKPFICGETINAVGVNAHLMALNSDTDNTTACIEGAGLPSIVEGGNHFSASALRAIGNRYAEQYFSMTR